MTIENAIQIREIRVFLSSTFRDMDVERTYLVKQVFPKVRAACLERQVGFSEIDLRWGVSEEESKNGATVEICLKEIDRCRDFPPFFVGFLGERYGWVPKHEDLSAYWDKHSDSEYAPAIRKAIEREISVTELEMELAVLGDGAAEKIAGHALFCLRDSKLTDTIYADSKASNPSTREVDFYDAGEGKLKALKHKIAQSGFLGLNNYTSTEQFGAAVENYLLAQLDRYFPADEVPTFLQRSNAAHAGFRFHRLQNFLPRTDVREQMIQAIAQRLSAPSLGPILVTGQSGQGKSALMADLARHYQTTKQKAANKKETWRVFDHYIGADNANHLEGWVDRILQTLHPDIKDIAGDIPESPMDKVEALSTWISMAARRNHCRYLFILDALDQLGDGGKNLDILTPQTLGPDGILIASAADNTPARISAANWQTHIEVPPLTDELRTRLVTDTLARYRKRLPENLASKLASAPQSGSPLFLGLALEELRLDARHESLAELIDDILEQPDAEHLFLNNFLLDEDYGRPELPTLAASFMALLGAARAGLSENELADLLAMPTDPIAEDTGKPRLPQIHLSRLLTNLAPFLLNKQGRRAPMHRIFGKAALEYYGTAPVREHLYAHFAPGYGKGKNEYDARSAAEALYQITELARLDHKGQKQARKQLVADLGEIFIPVLLHDDEINDGEKIVLDVLEPLTEMEQKQLKKHWCKEIGELDAEDVENGWTYIMAFGNWLEYWAHYLLALAVLEPLLKRQEQLLPTDHLEIANSSNSLGTLYITLERFEEAIPLLCRALAIREKALDRDHSDIATSLSSLATLLMSKSDYVAAEPLYRRALEIREKALDPDHRHVAIGLGNLATLLFNKGDYDGAEHLHCRALAISEKAYGSDHPDTAICLNNLGVLLMESKGDYAAAEPLYRRALAISEKAYGPDHPDTALSHNNLAELLTYKGDYAAAESLYRSALAISEKAYGPDHSKIATYLCNLGGVLMKSKSDYAAAELLHRRALVIFENQLGVDHPYTATSLINLAGLLKDQGDYAGAEPLYRRALAIRESQLSSDHPDTANSLGLLASLLNAQGDYAGAEPLYRRALAIREQIYGENSSQAAQVLYSLGRLLGEMGKHEEAEKMLRSELDISESINGEFDEGTLISMDNLAGLLEEWGKIDDSAALRFKQLAALERTVDLGSEKILSVLENLAKLLSNAGRLDEAEPLQRETVARYINVHGESGLQTAFAYSGLGALLKLKGELAEAETYWRKTLAICEREFGADDESTQLVRNRLDELLM